MKRFYTYVVRFQVEKTWIEDGFDLTDNRALEMLGNDLRYADMGSELTAKVIKAPSPERLARAYFESKPTQEQLNRVTAEIIAKRENESW